jgi:hypothetical protein
VITVHAVIDVAAAGSVDRRKLGHRNWMMAEVIRVAVTSMIIMTTLKIDSIFNTNVYARQLNT